ncbi:unnamed protein product, partial [Polarella glacialis]
EAEKAGVACSRTEKADQAPRGEEEVSDTLNSSFIQHGVGTDWTRWLFGPEADSAGTTLDDIAEGLVATLDNFTIVGKWARRFLTLQNEEEQRDRAKLGLPFGRSEQEKREQRIAYMDEKIGVDLNVSQRFTVPTVLPPWPGSVPQVAFLFMAMDRLDFEDVWDKFFEAAPDIGYSIFVHRANKRKDTSFADRFGGWGRTPSAPLGRWGAIDVPHVETRWCALFGVEVALLAAALQDSRNQQFVFLSHNTVPLKSYSYVYRELIEKSPATSKFCFAEPAFHKLATSETIRNELRRQCVFRDFYRSWNPRTLKHHQWVVLSREHAEIVVRRGSEALRIWRRTWELAAPDLLAMGEGCSDESVPVTALLHDISEQGRSTG